MDTKGNVVCDDVTEADKVVDHPDTTEIPDDGIYEQIKACNDAACLTAILWFIPEDIPVGTQ